MDTAARESLSRCKVPGKEYLYCIKPNEIESFVAPLSQQQGGEQEAACDTCGGRGWIDDGHEQDDGRMVSAPEDCPNCTDESTKQPAASEGDVNAAASNLNIAARYAKPEHAKLIVDAISLLRKLAPTNTSKRAAGEAAQ